MKAAIHPEYHVDAEVHCLCGNTFRNGSTLTELKTEVLSVTPLPRFLVKKPLFSPTRAGAWVMLARKPSRSVTCWLLLPPPLLPEPEEAEDDPHPTASAVIAAAPAASTTRLI